MEQKDGKRIFDNTEPSETLPAHIQISRLFTAKATLNIFLYKKAEVLFFPCENAVASCDASDFCLPLKLI